MKELHVKFITPDWAGWKLVDEPESTNKKSTLKLVVDEDTINETMEYGGFVAKAKEPFMESIMNIFVRFISSIVPGADLKCAYVLDFADKGKVNLFVANDVWSSTALITLEQPDKLDLLVDATKEYIRYRCFVDSIQPQ
jgi:hypothetical protein